jgi:hypothetical protein
MVQGYRLPVEGTGDIYFTTDLNLNAARLASFDLGLQVFTEGKYECRLTSTAADIRCPATTFPVHPQLQQQACDWECPVNAIECKCQACQPGDPVSVSAPLSLSFMSN